MSLNINVQVGEVKIEPCFYDGSMWLALRKWSNEPRSIAAQLDLWFKSVEDIDRMISALEKVKELSGAIGGCEQYG